jgi:hypothetical protein
MRKSRKTSCRRLLRVLSYCDSEDTRRGNKAQNGKQTLSRINKYIEIVFECVPTGGGHSSPCSNTQSDATACAEEGNMTKRTASGPETPLPFCMTVNEAGHDYSS